jgi:hypothetical protein
MKYNIHTILIFACAFQWYGGKAQDLPPTTTLIYPGTGGGLVYKSDSIGNRIPDFSHAGYKGGGVAIPFVPVKKTLWPITGDNSVSLQTAIDSISSLPPDVSGFRGAILLKMGLYLLENPIYIKASGVVLRGEGMSDLGTILIGRLPKEGQGSGMRRPALLNISGSAGCIAMEETKQSITDNYVPVGSRTFNVSSARGFKAGDKVLVRRFSNEEWIREIGQDSVSAGRFRWKPFTISYDRVITDVKGNSITIDAPVFCAIEKVWGGGDVVKYADSQRIMQVGVENLRGISEYNPAVRMREYGNMDRGNFDGRGSKYESDEYYADENHYFNFIQFNNVVNGWVRNVSALHFGSSVVQTLPGSKWITIQDCQSWEPVSVRAGARRFTFQLNGQLALVQRCFSQKGRHSFVMQGSASSGNVFLHCEAMHPFSSSEPHANWVNGALYDNVKAPLTARYWKDISIGWAGANVVFWNCEGDFIVQKPPTAQNYSFGHIGLASVIFNTQLQDQTKPNGHVEWMDKHVAPKSLYLTQLKDRLGENALKNILPGTGGLD